MIRVSRVKLKTRISKREFEMLRVDAPPVTMLGVREALHLRRVLDEWLDSIKKR